MPLFHVHGLLTPVLSSLIVGGSIIVPPRFSASGFWRVVERYKASWYSAVPTIHQVLLSRADQDHAPKKSSLRFARSSSMALAPSLMEAMEGRFGFIVLEGYGMTEASHQIASNPLPPKDRRPGSVGLPSGTKVAILSENGEFLPAETPGEVVIQGPNVTKGYADNPKASAEAFIEGWFRTGDLGVISKDGYVTLLGRIKELINRGGEKIAPIEIDNALLAHPKVAEAVAFGIPDPKYGEEVACAVVLKEPLNEAELRRFLMERLAAFKVPKTIHFVESLPRSGSGKISRKATAQAFTNP
jgi:acyl-CoA synthetase (AMP-forming)/AMP-acid ligase II